MRKTLIILSIIFLSSCSQVKLPVGIGKGTDSLKKSPCACMEIKQQWNEDGIYNNA